MANENERPRARGRAAAIGTRAGAEWVGLLGDRLAAGLAALALLIQAEARAARLAPWLPVAFGIDRRALSLTGAIGLRRVDGKWIAGAGALATRRPSMVGPASAA